MGCCHSGWAMVLARALKMPPECSRALGNQIQRMGWFGKDLVCGEGVIPCLPHPGLGRAQSPARTGPGPRLSLAIREAEQVW